MLKLTDQEKQEIIRFLEAGKELPEKYRFLLFEDKRAVEKNQVVFHDVSYIEFKPHITKGKKGQPPTVAVELTDFSVFYSQDSIAHAEAVLGKKKNGSQIVVEKGHIVKLIKDKKGIIRRESLTQHWTDWIDYWSVDFDFESKWQSFRTKKDRNLELKSVAHDCGEGGGHLRERYHDDGGGFCLTGEENVRFKN